MLWGVAKKVAVFVNRAALDGQILALEGDKGYLQSGCTVYDYELGRHRQVKPGGLTVPGGPLSWQSDLPARAGCGAAAGAAGQCDCGVGGVLKLVMARQSTAPLGANKLEMGWVEMRGTA